MKYEIPSDEQLREELHSTLAKEPQLKRCANCIHYSDVAGYCSKINKSFPRYMYGCKHYITAEEALIAKAKESLLAQAKECEKIEFIYAIALTATGMTQAFVEDFEMRVKAMYRKEKEAGHDVRNLRKDLDFAQQMAKTYRTIEGHLYEIEKQYRHYIQPHLDKIFKKEGVAYNHVGYDQFLSDSGEFAAYILEMARVAHHNHDNMAKVYEFMNTLQNENTRDGDVNFCLEDKDIERYRLKE